jgi:Ca2+-binding RTX toxin-like protein
LNQSICTKPPPIRAASRAKADTNGKGNTMATIYGTPGDDVINGTTDGDALYGLGGNDMLSGFGGNDYLDGAAGNDTLDGGTGDDLLHGGTGIDHLMGGNGQDRLVVDSLASGGSEDGDTFDGGAGIDIIYYNSAAGNVGVTVNLLMGAGSGGSTVTGIENIYGTYYADILTGDNSANDFTGLTGDDVMDGGGGDDGLAGGGGDDQLAGGDGDDGLSGGSGNDVLDGGAGNDVLGVEAGSSTDFDQVNGGDGNDTLDLSNLGWSVVIDLVAGTLDSYPAHASLTGIENVVGSVSPTTIIGNDADNLLEGGNVSDVLHGGDGNDRLEGGWGADSLYGDAGDDVLADTNSRSDLQTILDGGDGTDTVSYYTGATAVTVNLTAGTGSGGNAQGDILVSIENVTGSAGADQITGNALANALNGWAGQDVLRGGGGADRFVFTATSDSQVGAADRITDFSHAQANRVDLSAIDANTGAAGNQAFSFIGTGLFTHHAGELRYVSDGTVTTIAGDINGDGVSDFHIQLTGAIGLVAADFVL